MAVNANGLLCARVNGVLRQLDPAITIPSGQTRIDVNAEGHVTTERGYGGWTSVGQMCLYSFLSENLTSDDRMLVLSDQIGQPQECMPGQNGTGHILLGYRQAFVVPLNNTNFIAFGLTFITIVGCFYRSARPIPQGAPVPFP